ncbi:3-deoxy-manno-octulosonate cytidylyltransferase [Thermosulfuriphilus sp.]
MKIVAIIPARFASTRFPGKPLAELAGKPMIQHVYERVLDSPVVSRVVVATDDERIAEGVRSFGGTVVMTDQKHRCGTERIAEAANLLRLDPQDIVVNIQGDQPLLAPPVVEELVKPLLLDGDLPMATVATVFKREEDVFDPNRVKVVLDRQSRAIYFSRSPIPYFRAPGSRPRYLRHIGIYAYRRWALEDFVALPEGELEASEKLEQLRALENGWKLAVVITRYECPEVDTPEDLAYVERLLKEATPIR